MVTSDSYLDYVDPAAVPPLAKADCYVTLSDYPPFLDRLVGMWRRLVSEPLTGITADGRKIDGLYGEGAPTAPVAAAAAAAARWLGSLPPETRRRARFPLDSKLWRYWQNTPLVIGDKQVELERLTPDSRELAMTIIAASLSPEGYRRVREVMRNNQFLGQLVAKSAIMNEWSFIVSIFGEPSATEPWGWQITGHHLAMNCLFADGRMVLSPVFLGVEPDHEIAPDGRRLFDEHERRAVELFNALGGAQRDQALLYGSMLTADQPPGRFHPDDGRTVGGAFQDNRVVPYEGVAVAGLDPAQRSAVLALARLFVENLPDAPADDRMDEVARHLDDTYFAWIGPANDVDPFYFRLHSPVVLIEFDHHSGIFLTNSEPKRFHIHTIVRTPNGGDYGGELLRRRAGRTSTGPRA